MKILCTSFILILSLLFWNCSSDNKDIDNTNNGGNPEEPSNVILDISTIELVFSANGGEQEFDITCNTNWEIYIDSTWCTSNKTYEYGNKTIKVSVFPFIDTKGRKTNLVIKAQDKTKTLTITQTGRERKLTILSTVEDLKNYKNKGNKIEEGDLTIQGAEIKTLYPLGNLLEQINGDLTINCENLTTLDGLYNLSYIKGSLIFFNAALTTMEGLNKLATIGKDFEINTPRKTITNKDLLRDLTSFQGLESLKEIKGNLKIYATGLCSLKSFAGFDNLTSIEGDFTFIGSNYYYYPGGGNTGMWGGTSLFNFKSFSGFQNLKSVGGNFEISDEAHGYSDRMENLKTLQGFNNLTSIGGNFKILDMKCLETFEGLNELATIGGDFEISGEIINIKSIDAFGKLNKVQGDFKIKPRPQSSFALETLEGLDRKSVV